MLRPSATWPLPILHSDHQASFPVTHSPECPCPESHLSGSCSLTGGNSAVFAKELSVSFPGDIYVSKGLQIMP